MEDTESQGRAKEQWDGGLWSRQRKQGSSREGVVQLQVLVSLGQTVTRAALTSQASTPCQVPDKCFVGNPTVLLGQHVFLISKPRIRGGGTCPRSHSRKKQSQDSNPGLFTSRSPAFNPTQAVPQWLLDHRVFGRQWGVSFRIVSEKTGDQSAPGSQTNFWNGRPSRKVGTVESGGSSPLPRVQVPRLWTATTPSHFMMCELSYPM